MNNKIPFTCFYSPYCIIVRGSKLTGNVRLPNITGTVQFAPNAFGGWFDGCFGLAPPSITDFKMARESIYLEKSNVSFNASKSNSIYGKSPTVQPSALSLNYVIKA